MNYCILNGVKSNTVKGLLIQSLPPISKPLIRTQIEQIDGRDGDIVTTLGYAAYDKQMSIGLYGDYDIDDVIQFFNSSGTVTFSNEPDKYYNYQIINQIDFERLIRFKTATVTFHVQPFKYSAVDQTFTVSNQYVNMSGYTATKNGVTVNVSNGIVSIAGTATGATEFYIPIQNITLDAGQYSLSAIANGTGATSVSIRVINGVPSDAKSFGNTYLTLKNNDIATLNATLTGDTSYNYLWLYIVNGAVMNFTVDVALSDRGSTSVTLTNRGNINSRPIVTIYGSGTVNLSLNGTQIFIIDLALSGSITIDAAQMNAYTGDTLKNRQVIGDYENLFFKVGKNTLSWTGNVNDVVIKDFSRWI